MKFASCGTTHRERFAQIFSRRTHAKLSVHKRAREIQN
ncbi:hypothetical protein LEP1GSC060_3069 [Leptospira weilii serovar Ranarum str. ICFT]|uniref:Uncharacterized protein n=1 Tax=Leptospira weilii serovar Ranarum str. ICFT TaxID=1218598 RepID=N1WJR8_9LEPT|nr:hypothetical protein LEP1GSC060_3069 [Leptospira weilii serovar Ranarum str. ICFT]